MVVVIVLFFKSIGKKKYLSQIDELNAIIVKFDERTDDLEKGREAKAGLKREMEGG